MVRAIPEAPPISPLRLRMTYDEYLEWFGEGRYGEWVAGEVIVFMAPRILHQLLVGFLYRLLFDYADRTSRGMVFIEPTELWLPHKQVARLPDVFFVATAHLGRLTKNRFVGPADLVVEVVSDESVTRDRHDKRDEYEAAGVSEYLIVDGRPGHQWVGLLRLAPNGLYAEIPPDGNGRYHSSVLPGLWLDPDWLWREPLPRVSDLLATMIP